MSKTIKKELAQRGLVTVLGVPELVNRKGDSSLRETLYIREKDYSQFDEFKEELISTIYHLLINTGVYEVSVSFGESIIETKSFFGSYCYEVHEAEDILDNNFLLEQYPIISYKEKEIAMSENIDFTINSSYSQNNVNENWQKIMQKMANFSFVSKELIHNAVKNIINDTGKPILDQSINVNKCMSLKKAAVIALGFPPRIVDIPPIAEANPAPSNNIPV